MKIEVTQISEEKHLKKKVSAKPKKVPVAASETVEVTDEQPVPEPAALEQPDPTPSHTEPVVIKKTFKASQKYHRRQLPSIPMPRVANTGLLTRFIILVSAAALLIIGAQDLSMEYDNKIWNLLLTPFNIAIVIVGLSLITLYAIPPKRTRKRTR